MPINWRTTWTLGALFCFALAVVFKPSFPGVLVAVFYWAFIHYFIKCKNYEDEIRILNKRLADEGVLTAGFGKGN